MKKNAPKLPRKKNLQPLKRTKKAKKKAEAAPKPPIDKNEKKYCRFKKYGIKFVDYKEKNFLLRFLNPQGKILPRRLSGNTAKAQRMMSQAVKRARHTARLPFVADNLK